MVLCEINVSQSVCLSLSIVGYTTGTADTVGVSVGEPFTTVGLICQLRSRQTSRHFDGSFG